MHGDLERAKQFNRRVALLGGGKLLLAGVLGARMYYLQVVEGERYRMLADENRISLRLLPPPRGRILDRNGELLAINRQNFRVLVVAEQTPDINATLDVLSRLIPLSEHERNRVLRETRRRRRFVPVPVRENLTWEDMARIEVNAPDLPGIIIDEWLTRYYPYGEDLAHVLGYVAPVSEEDLGGDPLLELPGFRIGKAGVERVYDLALRGRGGTSQVEVNAVGRVIRELKREEGEAGGDVELTIDLALQKLAMERMEGHSASTVVLDIHTGEVIVLAATPAYDPNAFNRGLTSAEWNALISNPRAPLTNKAVGGQYAPGSTFKMVVALAALEAGAITPEQRIFCEGHMDLGNNRFHCWRRGGHGWMSMTQAIQHSCDVYFYEIARRIGVDRIAEMARRFGMGEVLGLELPGERAGLIPTRDWKRAAMGQPWHPGETLIAGIGQGYVLSTPLQLAVMTARLANDGLAVAPYLTRKVTEALETAPMIRPPPAVGINRANLAVVRKGMFDVVNHPRGTAYASRIDEPGLQISGKTGTSQVRRITMREREQGILSNEERPWRLRDHALFVAYGTLEAPRYAIAVVVEHGGGGSAVAAPIARDILLETMRRDPSRSSGPVAGERLPPTADTGEGA